MEISPQDSNDLENVLNEATSWLDENDIAVEEVGMFDRRSTPNAFWASKNWHSFLHTAQKAGTQIVWFQVERCLLLGDDEKSELLSLISPEESEDLKRLLTTLIEHEEQIVSLFFYWAYEGVLNALMVESEWIEDYHDYQEELKEVRRRANAQSRAIERSEINERNQKERNAKARALLEHPDYEYCQNRNDRKYLARQMFDTHLSIKKIVHQAETLDRME